MVEFLWDNIFKKVQSEKSIVHILSENILFEQLSKRELRFLEKIVHIRKYRAGETIFRQGETGVGMYLIAEGSINILIEELDRITSRQPKQILITRLKKGDFFGEISLVEDNDRRTATARAHVDAKLIGFFKPDLMEIAERSPSTGIKIILKLSSVLAMRLKETTRKVTDLRKEIKKIGNE